MKARQDADLPYVVVFRDGESAIFNRKYTLLPWEASQRLITFAKANNTLKKHCFQFTKPEQQPSWMREFKRTTCILYFLWDDLTTDTDLETIPKK